MPQYLDYVMVWFLSIEYFVSMLGQKETQNKKIIQWKEKYVKIIIYIYNIKVNT